jgi:hypothetical protein
MTTNLTDAGSSEVSDYRDDKVLLCLLAEGMQNGYVTVERIFRLPDKKLERLLDMLLRREIKVIKESEIGNLETCPGCNAAKSIKFAFYFEKRFRAGKNSNILRVVRVRTDLCGMCLDEKTLLCPNCRTERQLKAFYHVRAHATRYKRSDHCDRCDRWARSGSKVYNISATGLLEMRAAQEGVCAICRRILTNSLHIDHCHESDQVRGLLCGKCNLGLGLYKNDPHLLRAAAAYLERSAGGGSH